MVEELATTSYSYRHFQMLNRLPDRIIIYIRASPLCHVILSIGNRCPREGQSEAGILGSYGSYNCSLRKLKLSGGG